MATRKGSAGADRSGVVGLLDIGTSKVACLIAGPGEGSRGGASPVARILGIGHQRSRGVKAGVITDLDEAEACVRAAIAQAERMARVELGSVFVAVACGRLKSLHFAASADVETGVVSATDLLKVTSGARCYAERDGRSVVHLNRLACRLDGAHGGLNPQGLAASQIGVDFHAVTADEAPLRNLMLIVERCHLRVEGLVAAPYASAIATTSEEERQLGVTCIDLGAGTATISTFSEGHLVRAEAMPIGGHHISYDIARGLQTPLVEAERIKTLYGTMVVAQSDSHESFTYPLSGEDHGSTKEATRAELASIIRPRVQSILGLVRERLEEERLRGLVGERIVLTGGTSQLTGIGGFAANALGRPVRVSGPQPAVGLPPSISSSAFAVLAGLVLATLGPRQETIDWGGSQAKDAGYFGRVGQWLKSGF